MQWTRNQALTWSSLFFLTVGVLWGGYYLLVGRFYQSTEDAYVGGNLMHLAMQTHGLCTSIHADVPGRVGEGQLLVQIDPTDAELALERSREELALTAQQVMELFQQRQAAEAALRVKEAALQRARIDLANREPLVANAAIPREEFEHAVTTLEAAQAERDHAEELLQAAQALVGCTEPQEHPRILLAATALRQSYLQLLRTTLQAPASSVVTQRAIQVGEWVAPERRVMSLLPLDQVWVDANFRELHLRNVHVGQPVSLWADLYGRDVQYKGTVAGITPGSGGALSLLPPQNATGNWIKIVQRFPVRIVLSPDNLQEYPLYLGASMHVTVDVHDRTGPRVQEQVATHTIASTSLYPLDLQPIEEEIQAILQQHLVSTCYASSYSP